MDNKNGYSKVISFHIFFIFFQQKLFIFLIKWSSFVPNITLIFFLLFIFDKSQTFSNKIDASIDCGKLKHAWHAFVVKGEPKRKRRGMKFVKYY